MRRPYIRRNRAAANWISCELRATDFLARATLSSTQSCQLAPSSAASSCCRAMRSRCVRHASADSQLIDTLRE